VKQFTKDGQIPVGLATKLGTYTTVAGILVALILEATGTNLDPDTLKVAGGGLIALLTTMVGRFAQAYAQYRDVPVGVIEDGSEMAEEDHDESQAPPVLKTPEDLPRA
jgi:hypothetical protein